MPTGLELEFPSPAVGMVNFPAPIPIVTVDGGRAP